MLKRCMLFMGFTLAICMGSFTAFASERLQYVTAASWQDSHAVQNVVHQLTLSQWRLFSESPSTFVASNLIAISNHYGLASALPFASPDWPATSAA